jgi:ribose/xylose/arabinose/galactoside ABC-type transport system permease subunit
MNGKQTAFAEFLRRLLLSDSLILLLCAAYFLIMIPLVPNWTSVASMSNVLQAMLPLFVVAVGQMFVLIIAGVDLSVTAIVGLVAVVGASIMTSNGGYLAGHALAMPVAVLAMLVTGTFIGLINGVSVAWGRMPPFMVTLATGMFFAGAAIWYNVFHTETSSIAGLPRSFTALANDSIPRVPNFLWLVAVAGLVAHMLLRHTVFGRELYAVGLNREAARVSGVRVQRTIVGAFVICAVFAAIGGVVYTAQLETGDPRMGQRILLDVIGAAVIGGTSLFGGKGAVVWTFFGVLFLTLIDASLAMLGIADAYVLVAKGAVILFAATLDAVRHRLLGSSS